jgi:hypothetical protein
LALWVGMTERRKILWKNWLKLLIWAESIKQGLNLTQKTNGSITVFNKQKTKIWLALYCCFKDYSISRYTNKNGLPDQEKS